MKAYAYIRKSVVQVGAATLSWEIQEAEVRALADRHGDGNLEILSDWGRSGRGEKTHLRTGYAKLLSAIDSGGVSAVYAYSLSRLSRSVLEYARLAELCEARGVKLRTCKEGETDFTTASGRVVARILMVIAQMEAELATERSKDMIRARQARGDRLGREPYGMRDGEDLGAVVAAYRAAGSLHGAARALNGARVPTRQGGAWKAPTVKSVLSTSAPGLLPVRPQQGVSRMGTQLLTRLLKCHCKATLTPSRNHSGVRYRCSEASVIPMHGKASVAESIVLPWVRSELSRVRPPDAELQVAEDRTERRDALLEDLRRNLVAFQARAIDDATFLATKEALDAELEKLDAEGLSVVLEPPDWDRDPPALVNDWARSFLRFVQMDDQMRPAFADWILPAWRSSEPREA